MGFGCLGCPARLSAPVTLTLALSRQAGEGISPPPPPPTRGIVAKLCSDAMPDVFA